MKVKSIWVKLTLHAAFSFQIFYLTAYRTHAHKPIFAYSDPLFIIYLP